MVLAHGFTQTGRLWGTLADDLASDHQIVQADLPGHGDSAQVSATLVDGALKLVDVGGTAAYLGYSMGARFCLHVALARPDVVQTLVLISGTAGIEDSQQRRDRRASDLALANRLDPPEGSTAPPLALESFLRQWMGQPMFANLGSANDGIHERLRNTGPGLASSLRLAGTGNQRPLWGHLSRLSMPVLVITGQQDAKFTGLGAQLVDSIGANAEHVVISGAGHAPHLERPDAVARLVRAHIQSRHP